jgi:hypothetical protein
MTALPAAHPVRTFGPFLLLVAWLIAIKLVIMGGSPAFRSPAQVAVFVAGLGGVGVLVFVLDYAANAAQVVVFRNAGFLAIVTLRIAFYLVWHVAPSLGLG